MVQAVIFDLDGVLLDSEAAWDKERRELVRERGGTWTETATRDMMGMSSPEWARYLAERLGVDLEPAAISEQVAQRLLSRYREELPLVRGAVEAAERLAARWPLGLASSSNPEVIELVLSGSALGRHFAAWVSSEEVGRGKPAPDVYLEAARRLDVPPDDCVAIEDSENGIRSANSAGMRVIAVPDPEFPSDPDALALADRVVESLDELTRDLVESLRGK
ncbi:MAG TPA: HAD family phosphatase [Solirubrobacterales bacterium]|nr:HAD family phosphatase [Solirubrobacterales bacterium]